MNTFKNLLGTANKKDQLARIQELLLKEANPEVTLQITYNGLSDKITMNMLGGDVPFDTAHRMLAEAGIAIRKQELQMALVAQAELDQKKE